MEISKRIGDNLSVLPKLFSMGLEEIIQNIFLHLDPKEDLTCKTSLQLEG